MLQRWITDRLLETLGHASAVGLLGARQVGKTTLARSIAARSAGPRSADPRSAAAPRSAEPVREALYLDLEAPQDLAKLTDPGAFLRAHGDKLVILDEIQRLPELFAVLRGVIDDNRWQGRQAGQFLLLGSASVNLLQQTSESLAGRISYLEMGGLNGLEIEEESPDNRAPLERLWLRGGFPSAYLAADDDRAMHWLEDLLRTYLERDVPQLGFRVPANRLRRLWTMLAHLQGEPVNTAKLAGNLEVQRAAVNQYLDILTDLLLVRRLQPWHSNMGKRLVKSPRYYVRDSGILHRLLGIDSLEELLSRPVLGKSWEGFVIENIHSVLPHRAETWFYRTAAGAEIDLLIRLSASEMWAVEIKYGSAPKPSKHFSPSCADIGVSRKFIVYSGTEEFPLRDDVTAISLPGLMRLLG